MPVVAVAEQPQMRPKSPGLDLLKKVNGSEVRKLSISVSSGGKHPGRLCQTHGHSRLREAIPLCSVYIPKISAVYHLLLLTTAGNRNKSNEQWQTLMWYRHLCDTDTYDCNCIVCVWAGEASLKCWIIRRTFHSPQTQLKRGWILPFQKKSNSVSDYDIC